eukprot:scaffold7453_cov128-Isochrysis_galbana.AAC.17
MSECSHLASYVKSTSRGPPFHSTGCGGRSGPTGTVRKSGSTCPPGANGRGGSLLTRGAGCFRRRERREKTQRLRLRLCAHLEADESAPLVRGVLVKLDYEAQVVVQVRRAHHRAGALLGSHKAEWVAAVIHDYGLTIGRLADHLGSGLRQGGAGRRARQEQRPSRWNSGEAKP